MATADFDPDVPVGEPTGYQPPERFTPKPNPTPPGNFDPDIPVGEPGGYRPAQRFAPPNPTPAGGFGADIPVGEPGGYQPVERFSPEPMPTSTGEFDPDTASAGPRSREKFGPEHAGLGIRLPARLIDFVLCVFVASMIAPKLGHGDAGATDPSLVHAYQLLFQLLNFWILSLILGVVSFVYFMVFESALGWTPAKKLFGLSVHASNRPGSPKPSLKEAALRNRFLLLLTFFLVPYLNILFFITTSTKYAFSILNSTNGRGKHDILANTEVMRGQPI